MTILETYDLTKRYRKITALNGLNLRVSSQQIFGLLGPNGSGKTTTLGMLLGVLKPTSGHFTWFGQPPKADSRKRIGAILESPCFYPYMTAVQNLTVAARIKECPAANMDPVLRLTGLYDRRDDSFKTYSLGMKQRLAIASALLADPEVLILDEPTNGLDPQGIVEIREVIRKISATGKTIILASHLLYEVQKVCTHFAVLKSGNKLYQGSVSEALADQTTIQVAARDMDLLKRTLSDFAAIMQLEEHADHLVLHANPGIDTEMINRFLVDHGIIVTHLVRKTGNLEAQFLKILSAS